MAAAIRWRIRTERESRYVLAERGDDRVDESVAFLGETSLDHVGLDEGLQDRALFAVVFDERTNLGMVRYYASETTRRLDVVLTEVANRPEGEGEEKLASDFSKSATAALDQLF